MLELSIIYLVHRSISTRRVFLGRLRSLYTFHEDSGEANKGNDAGDNHNILYLQPLCLIELVLFDLTFLTCLLVAMVAIGLGLRFRASLASSNHFVVINLLRLTPFGLDTLVRERVAEL